MHYLYFTKVSKKEAKTSEEAREVVNTKLQNEGFVGDGGYFSASKCDWFVIGGRWSGELQSLLLNKDYYKVVREQYKNHKDVSDFGFSHGFIENEAKNLQKIWEDLGGKGINPLNRDQYKELGYEDDAMIITKEMIKALKKKEYKHVEMFDSEHYEESLISEISDKDIGSWLVVIDYHS